MSKSKNQKLKILYILEALKKTDEQNPISVNELIDYLARERHQSRKKKHI
jgi:hypothetical protein